jgi:hypothetical protein
MKRALLSGVAALALVGAASAEGYVSGSYTGDEFDSDTWSVNGRYLLGGHVLLDGGYSSIDGDVDVWRIGGHAFARGTDWLLGGYLGYESAHASSSGITVDGIVIAGEGQYHLERVTLAATVSYSDAEFPAPTTIEMWNVGGTVRYFVTDNFGLQANAAWLNGEALGLTGDGSQFGVGAEYQFDSSPVSIFAGYRHTEFGGGQNSWGIGLRWNFGEGTLLQRDRSGERLARPESTLETISGDISLD